ncbi:MAG: recombinase family protein [Tissierellia bacterium]|jgi:DNA invertase Pin-like site-specific DNA recombinase|nr:recombinase family protein [Tissierellia bacterium]
MKRNVIYVYGKTMESISERYELCKQVIADAKELDVYIDIQIDSGYRPGLKKLIEDVEADEVNIIYIAGIQNITRNTVEYINFKNYIEVKGSSIVDVHSLNKNVIPDNLLEISSLIDIWIDKLHRNENL